MRNFLYAIGSILTLGLIYKLLHTDDLNEDARVHRIRQLSRKGMEPGDFDV